jgi:hypothetical protein
VTRAGSTPRYVEVAHGLLPGVSRRVAVLEMASRPNWWRVWVDHRPASAPIFLPGSHGTWRGIATVESWGAGSNVCNGFGYRFDRIVVAQNAGGAWRELDGALPIRSGGYRMNVVSRASFVATSGKLLKPEAVRAELSASKPKPKPAPASAPAPAEPQPAAP